MASNWPSNPSNGDTYLAGNGTTYTYNSTTKSWKATGSGSDAALQFSYGLTETGNVVSVDTDKIVDTDYLETNAAGRLDLAGSGDQVQIRVRNIANDATLGTSITIDNSRTDGIIASRSGIFLDLSADTDFLATRDYVNGEVIDDMTYALLNSNQATYSNNIAVGSGQAYVVQNSGGHTRIFVGEPHANQRHHTYIKLEDASDNSYSIYRVKYTDDFHSGNATEFVCEATPVFNSGNSEVDEDASSFIISATGDGSISLGPGLIHDSETGAIEVDTDFIRTYADYVTGARYLGGSGTDSSNNSYTTIRPTFASTGTWYRVFVSGGEEIRASVNGTALATRTY